jgi:Peptidase family U32
MSGSAVRCSYAGSGIGDPSLLPASTKTFPDGVRYRIEIPSVEGPGCIRAVLAEAQLRSVPVRRMSQGSGVFLLTDAELDDTAYLAAEAGAEMSLFARPVTGWGVSSTARSQAGGSFAASVQGDEGLRAALDDIFRAAEHGIRSVLISDVGLLAMFGRLREAGDLPLDMQAKVSVMLAISNPATAEVLVELGANTLNLQTDLSLAQIAQIRAAVDVPLDLYVEAPDSLGGCVRLTELPEIVRIASPVYIKFGLRNAPDVYPAGSHLEHVTTALCRERVRRAKLGLELLERSGTELETSAPGAPGLAVPVIGLRRGRA